MANKTLFRSTRGKQLPKSDMYNEAGGAAYAFKKEHALAQYAVTGCLNSTFYALGEEQLDKVLAMSKAAAPEFVAQSLVVTYFILPIAVG